jgi:uncharacterized protein YbjT (DUF2867 family)
MFYTFRVVLAALLWQSTCSFVIQQGERAGMRPPAKLLPTYGNVLKGTLSNDAFEKSEDEAKPSTFQLRNRRQMIADAKNAVLLGTLLSGAESAFAAAESSIGASPERPIVILGAGGKCGKLCTQILADKKLYVRAATRDGRQVLGADSPYVTYGVCDVTNFQSLNEAVSRSSGVIFAASASGKAKGGVPREVDYMGAANTAKACLQQKVPKLVLISAGTVTRPTSPAFKQTNYFVKDVVGEKIMDYKIAGESAVRDLYEESSRKGLAYTIVRPGGLNGRPSKGPSKIHISQGDVCSSEISREDVALVTVAALLKGPATDFTTFELNQVAGLTKAIASLPDLPSELIHTGASSYSELLDGLFTDTEMKSKYSDIISNFRGDV